MGLAKRVIPVLLHRGHSLYKGMQFDAWRSIGHAAQAVRIHQARSVDELILLNIDETKKGPDFAMVESLSSDCFTPLTVGGGVRTLEDVKGIMDAGGDKVAICTAALEDRNLILRVSEHWGSQAVVAVVEVKDGRVSSHGGKKAWPLDPVDWARTLEKDGAGEILLSVVERDGRMIGYDLNLIRSVNDAVNIPVIALGGAGTYEHMLQAIQHGANAVAASAMFAFTDQTPLAAVKYLRDRGVEVRIEENRPMTREERDDG
jgi:imidazole glycerol-phosphate synthase subunit HisF